MREIQVSGGRILGENHCLECQCYKINLKYVVNDFLGEGNHSKSHKD